MKNSTNIVEYYIQNPKQPIRSRKNLKFYLLHWLESDKKRYIKSGLRMKLKFSILDIHLKRSGLRESDSSSVSINALIHEKSLLFHKY